MKIKLIPLIDNPIPFNQITEIFPIKIKLEVAKKDDADFIQKISEKDSSAKNILQSFSNHLKSKERSFKDRYIIILDKQISYRNKTILGLSELEGNSIVSLCLLQKDADVSEEDAIKIILHELGHGFGLKHCRVKNCIMSKLEKRDDLKRQRNEFCEKCKKKIETYKTKI